MQPKRISLLAFLAFLIAFSFAYLGGVAAVPFHPDESTFLFLSADFELFFQNPMAQAWQPENQAGAVEGGSEIGQVQRYRTLDAPLGRYLVGFGRWLVGLEPLPVDWNWGLSWEENRQAGALPSAHLLLAGRLGIAMLTPVSVLLLFLTGRRLGGERVGWLAALLLAGNALVLLHARRAMSEGAVIFTVTLVMWSLVTTEKRSWLGAVPAALAFCAKHSLAVLAPVGALAALWLPGQGQPESRRNAIKGVMLYALIFVLVVIALNPVVWAHPLQAVQDSIANRQDLVKNQVADRPEQEMKSPALRLVVMLGHLFIVRPIFAETGNYVEETRAAEEAYLSNPLHTLMRSLFAGIVLMLASLYGYLAMGVRAARQRPLPRGAILLLAASLIQALALLATVQLPFQRYYLPLVPHACLWAAYGLDILVTRISALRG